MGAGNRVLVLVVVLGSASCATTETRHRDWSTYDGPGRAQFLEEEFTFPELNDPGEPVNRAVDEVKHAGAEYVVAPLASVWRLFVPEAVRTGIANAGSNLLFPVRVVGALAQGDTSTAGTETHRFLYNTTVGVLGIRDAATEAGIEAPRAQDLGRALAHHGWDDSAYTALISPTVRDNVGRVGDSLLDPMTYLPGASPVYLLNGASAFVDDYVQFTKTTYDPYRIERMVRVLDRELPDDVDHVEFEPGDGGASQTLQHVFLGYRDRTFAQQRAEADVPIAATGQDVPYTYWLQPRRAPLVFVLPGLGGHRNASASGALCEMAFAKGYSVATISSAANHEFIATAGTSHFPGFPVTDARDVHVALTAVDADLRKRYPGRLRRRRALMGMSLGACHALYIAAAEDAAEAQGLIPFDGYLAINPPVSLSHGARQLDAYFNLPQVTLLDDEERTRRLGALMRHVIDIAGAGDLRPGRPIPLSDMQSKFLIGLAFRMTVMDVLDQARDLGRTGDTLLTPRTPSDRGASYDEIARYSFAEYFLAFVMPELAARFDDIALDDAGVDRVIALADLRSIELELMNRRNVRVMTNVNDFLLRPEDVDFLRRTFRTRLTLNDSGGHLGNLWQPAVQDAMMDELRHVVPVD